MHIISNYTVSKLVRFFLRHSVLTAIGNHIESLSNVLFVQIVGANYM